MSSMVPLSRSGSIGCAISWEGILRKGPGAGVRHGLDRLAFETKSSIVELETTGFFIFLGGGSGGGC